MTFKTVLLPQPLGPSSATVSRRDSVKETSFNASVWRPARRSSKTWGTRFPDESLPTSRHLNDLVVGEHPARERADQLIEAKAENAEHDERDEHAIGGGVNLRVQIMKPRPECAASISAATIVMKALLSAICIPVTR